MRLFRQAGFAPQLAAQLLLYILIPHPRHIDETGRCAASFSGTGYVTGCVTGGAMVRNGRQRDFLTVGLGRPPTESRMVQQQPTDDADDLLLGLLLLIISLLYYLEYSLYNTVPWTRRYFSVHGMRS